MATPCSWRRPASAGCSHHCRRISAQHANAIFDVYRLYAFTLAVVMRFLISAVCPPRFASPGPNFSMSLRSSVFSGFSSAIILCMFNKNVWLFTCHLWLFLLYLVRVLWRFMLTGVAHDAIGAFVSNIWMKYNDDEDCTPVVYLDEVFSLLSRLGHVSISGPRRAR